MSSIKIRDLPEKTDNLDDEDLMIVEDSEDTKKITLIKLRSIFSMDGILTSMKNMLSDKIDSFIESYSKKLNDLVSRNEDLERICFNLQNDHDHDAERIFELENKLINKQDKVLALQEDKKQLFEVIKQLQTDKDNLLDQINTLNKQIMLNDSNIVVLRSQVKDLQQKCKELKEINKQLEESLDKLESDISSQIDNNYNETQTKLSESIDDLMAYIRYYHPDVDNL